MECKYCGDETNGMILVWGKGGFPICGKTECKEMAVNGM